MSIQLFQPQLNSNIGLYRYHLPDLGIKVTQFSHSKVNQWSQSVNFAIKNVSGLLPFVTSTLTNGSYEADTKFGLILLLKHKSTTSSILQNLLNSTHTYLKGINLYIITVGVTSSSLSVDYRDMFPAGTKYANIRDMDHVAMYSMDIFKDICPGTHILRFFSVTFIFCILCYTCMYFKVHCFISFCFLILQYMLLNYCSCPHGFLSSISYLYD